MIVVLFHEGYHAHDDSSRQRVSSQALLVVWLLKMIAFC